MTLDQIIEAAKKLSPLFPPTRRPINGDRYLLRREMARELVWDSCSDPRWIAKQAEASEVEARLDLEEAATLPPEVLRKMWWGMGNFGNAPLASLERLVRRFAERTTPEIK